MAFPVTDSDRRFLRLASIPMLLLAFSTIYPIVFTFSNALKSSREFIRQGYGLPQSPTVEKFVTAWSTSQLGNYFINSIVVTVIGVVLVLFVASLAGFALGQLQFRFRRAIFLLLLTGLMIPVQVIMVPLFHVVLELGMLNSRIGLGIVYAAFSSPFGVYLMASYYRGIPKELSEAARVDGATLWQIYLRIMLPLGRPALVTLGIITTLHCWNDVLISLLILQENRTLMVGIAALRGEYGADIPLIAASVIIGAAPVIAIFLVFQRKILSGILIGSVRG